MHCTAPSKLFGISSTPRHGTKPLRHSIGLTIGRAKPFPCFCTSYGGCPLMLHLLSDWEYPHWMMMAGAIIVALGFMGFAFYRNRNGRGVNVTVYGLNPWNSMLTFGVDAGAVPNKTDLQGFCDIITERLKRLYDVGSPHVEG